MYGKYKQLGSVSMQGTEGCLSPDLPKTSPWSETQEAATDESMSGLGGEANTRIAAVVRVFHIHEDLGLPR